MATAVTATTMKKSFVTLIAIAGAAFSGNGARAPAIPLATSAARTRNSISIPNEEPAQQEFSVLMHKLIEEPPDACNAGSVIGLNAERQIFEILSNAVLGALNKASGPPADAAQAALDSFQRVGAKVTVSWSADERLRYKVLPVQPLLVLKLAIWNQDTFVVYAPGRVSAPHSLWKIAKSGTADWGGDAPAENLEMFPLWRGPSENPRFLIVKHFSGCMAGMTYDYMVDGYEWKGEQGRISTIFEKESEISTVRFGKLQTTGKTIVIPYCWSGDLNLGTVWAPICSLDTYDFSGDAVRLVNTQNNPEDLAVIENVIESAGSRDLSALATHCRSREVARNIMQTMPSHPSFIGYSRKQLGVGKEQIDLSDDTDIKFTLEKQGSHWLVESFQLTN